jgi:16S rRNA (adenine1518-N6/adenine1519-N6)-dimethyltransferase
MNKTQNMPKNFRFSKRWGQNFLIDKSVSPRIAAESGASNRDVLEIGPGMGALTLELAPLAKRVLSVEVDSLLIDPLNVVLKASGVSNVSVVNADIMKANLNELLAEHFPLTLKSTNELADEPPNELAQERPIVCANLPYSITTPVISKLIESKLFSSLTVMIQKEVALRISAKPGTSDYGAFSVFCRYHSEPTILFSVPPTAFNPQPKVTSAVVRFDLQQGFANAQENEIQPADEAFMFKVVKFSFAQRRKTLANALSAGFAKPRDLFLDVILRLGYDPNLRGETLSVAQFSELANALKPALDASKPT